MDHISTDKRAFYEYHASFLEPWDGPAAMLFTDGRLIGGTLDRNGLRPCRYLVTTDGLAIIGSEAGVVEFPPERIRIKGRLSDSVSGAFEDFTAAVKPAETVMRGELRDQSELHGLLDRIQSLGLELIEVRRLPSGERPA